MTMLAPLNHHAAPACRITSGLKRNLFTAAMALAMCGCATQVSFPDAAKTASPQSLPAALAGIAPGAEAASVTTGDTTPSMRMLGATTDRKRALRNLARQSVRADHPEVYSVVKGDTLWDISERFLSRPWLWPEIWQVNPQIENPHLIYPGDQVALKYVDGQPQLQLIRASSRASSNSGNAISYFSTEAIKPFIADIRIVSKQALDNAPYVVSTEDDRLIASIGNHIYARGDVSEGRYNIYRPSKALIDPDTNEVLGHEAIHVSKASLIQAGDPSKLVLTSNKRETLVGDRLMTNDLTTQVNFQPNVANLEKSGKIISLFDALARVGQNQVVVINLGANDGVQPGDILNVYGNDRKVRDVVSGKRHDWVTIDGEKAGVLMVFRSFERASYALVVQSERTINLQDNVGNVR